MTKSIFCTLASLFSAFQMTLGICQSIEHRKIINISVPAEALTKISSLPTQINEASGLAITNKTNLWTHNDGGAPVLFCLDTAGQLIKTLYLNHKNNGWEDLATDSRGWLYVGSFGNNKNDRKDLKIYQIPNPDSITSAVFTAQIISFTYEDQYDFPPQPSNRNFDCDAFIVVNDTIFLFTKNRTNPFTGYTRIYKLPAVSGNHRAQLVDSLFLGNGAMMDNWVTGADYNPENNLLALLGHSSVWIIKDFNPNGFSNGKILRFALDHYTHKAGIAFKSKNSLYIIDEKEFGLLGGALYYLNLKAFPELKK